jgi:hypothetical protein
MSDPTPTPARPTNPVWMTWIGRLATGLITAALTMSAVMKFLQPKELVEGFGKFGFDLKLAQPIGIVELVCVVFYVFPKTTVLGAILITGYLGGAIATHVRVQDGEFGPPLVIGVLAWLGVYFREPRLRALAPWRS